jgi:dTDP-4-amino-4,6-dideoxygalactose transaminase
MLLVAEPNLGEDEKAALCDVINSGWITMGERVRTFEKSFAELHGVPDAVAVNSCTAALHLILEAMGVTKGDEVLVPSMSFVATANSVLYTGASPVFVDIESMAQPVISLADAAAKVTPKTKAVIVMHYGGYLVDKAAWRHFADSRGLILVEDAAHAAGAEDVGTIGHATAYSFYGNKNMTTAEGGMVTAEDPAVLERIRQMRGHGLTIGTFQRLTNRAVNYDVTMLGFNYRMDELRAAIGIVQLKNLAAWNQKRKVLTSIYVDLLGQRCPAIDIPFAQKQTQGRQKTANHIMAVVLPKSVQRQNVINVLRDAGVQTTMHYPPSHQMTLYQERDPTVRLPMTEEYSDRELTLPLHPKMEASDVEKVVAALEIALKQTA